jgi:hypothetical protein
VLNPGQIVFGKFITKEARYSITSGLDPVLSITSWLSAGTTNKAGVDLSLATSTFGLPFDVHSGTWNNESNYFSFLSKIPGGSASYGIEFHSNNATPKGFMCISQSTNLTDDFKVGYTGGFSVQPNNKKNASLMGGLIVDWAGLKVLFGVNLDGSPAFREAINSEYGFNLGRTDGVAKAKKVGGNRVNADITPGIVIDVGQILFGSGKSN